MDDDKKNLKDWPKDEGGWPVLTGTYDAVMYGRLVSSDLFLTSQLSYCRRYFLSASRRYRRGSGKDLQLALDFACQAQFYREAYEEAIRYKKEVV